MRHTIKIQGTATTQEIIDALDEIKQYIEEAVELGEEDRIDCANFGIPESKSLDEHRVHFKMKLA